MTSNLASYAELTFAFITFVSGSASSVATLLKLIGSSELGISNAFN
jgi:hypothetical protein